MKVSHTHGQNLYGLEDEAGKVSVFELPKKLRHVVFIRPGTFVFARPDATRRKGAVQGDIEAVVLDCFLSELRKADFWPSAFSAPSTKPVNAADGSNPSETGGTHSEQSTAADPKEQQSADLAVEPGQQVEASGAGESESESEEDMSDLLALGRNPNRASWAYYNASSSEEDEA